MSGSFYLPSSSTVFEQINHTAWFCLLIEDADPKDLVGDIYLGQYRRSGAIFFAPISGFLINSYSVVPVLRCCTLSLPPTCSSRPSSRYRQCDETAPGKLRIAETKDISVLRMLLEYNIWYRQC
jgi:hypothetical protein